MKKLLFCLFTSVLAQASTLNLPLEPFTNKFDIVVSDNFSYVLRSEKIRNVYNVEKWSEENGRYGVLNQRK